VGTRMGVRGARLALLLLLAAAAPRASTPHAGCVHRRAAIKRPSFSTQAYDARRQGADAFSPLRVTFDFSRVDGSAQPAAQKAYVKGLLGQAGAWLNNALKVRPVAGALKFGRGRSSFGAGGGRPDCGDVMRVCGRASGRASVRACVRACARAPGARDCGEVMCVCERASERVCVRLRARVRA
jgi:hypothetical protein